MKISKKSIKEINFTSATEDIIRKYFGDKRYGDNNQVVAKCFIDTPPEMWENNEKQIFDMLTEQEYLLKDKIKEILGVEIEK